ncbi:MAG: 5-(carboxyamino)imidazole ribonucleotide mutase [Patescibacteria group bacterium]|jgi:5-(carboxyamino)imidazole ribonucleotide mutase
MTTEKRPIAVGVIIGSDSDVPIVEKAKEILEEFKIPYAATICSAHRTPEDLERIVRDWEQNRGCKIFIAAAGAAAHLAGTIASRTVRPVIAIPIAGKTLTAVNGLDALLSSAQMPTGIPVATVAINGAANAALLAIEILAISDTAIENKLSTYRKKLIYETRDKAEKLKKAGWPD